MMYSIRPVDDKLSGIVLVLVWVCTLYLCSADDSPVRCKTGEAVSANYSFNFTVTKINVFEDMEDHTSWPGAPTNLKITVNGTDIYLTWKMPDDASARDLNGFLAQIFIDDSSDVTYTDSINYQVKLQTSLILPRPTPSQADQPLVQDASFHLRCSVSVQRPAEVTFTITSLPLGPNEPKEGLITAVFKDPDISSSPSMPTTSLAYIDPIRNTITNPSSSEDTGPIVAVAIAVFVATCIGVGLGICIFVKSKKVCESNHSYNVHAEGTINAQPAHTEMENDLHSAIILILPANNNNGTDTICNNVAEWNIQHDLNNIPDDFRKDVMKINVGT